MASHFKQEKPSDPGELASLLSLCKRRGFLFPGSDIYGGLGSCWDYGPLGAQLKRNIKREWWNHLTRRGDMVGLDSAVFMHPRVWEASGHLEGFTDPLSDCKDCKHRFLGETAENSSSVKTATPSKPAEKTENQKGGRDRSGETAPPPADRKTQTGSKLSVDSSGLTATGKAVEGFSPQTVPDKERKAAHSPAPSQSKCPRCGSKNITEPRNFNLMFKSFMGPLEDESALIYLRPETAQGIYVNFQNIQKATRKPLPFGVAQIGKSFRNEITPSHLIFRMREFEQMEMQFFIAPAPEEGDRWFEFWKEERLSHLKTLGLDPKKLRFHSHGPEELAHYAKKAVDIEYEFPMGWRELEGVHNRGDFDLSRHEKFSGKNLQWFDPEQNKSFIPHIIETSIGCDRLFLALLCSALTEEEVRGEKRTVLKLNKTLAPVQTAILPLSKKPPLMETARKIQQTLSKTLFTDYDVSGAIGRRYRRQDEVGTPYCVTVDFDSLTDEKVTVRERDSMIQERVPIASLTDYFSRP